MQIVFVLLMAGLIGLGIFAAVLGIFKWWMVALVALLLAGPIMMLQNRIGGVVRGATNMVIALVLMLGGYFATRLITTGSF